MANDTATDTRIYIPSADAYLAMEADPRFQDLRRRFRTFTFTWTAVGLGFYLLYVLMSAYARDFMETTLFGNINVALVFGLLQFVSTFGIAWLYSRYADRELDPLADELREELHR
jgi:uncharacterized membrane protein (DUF485 family)